MKLHLLLIGNKFIHNKILQNYITRTVEKKFGSIDSIVFFKENDSSLFLYLEKELNLAENFIIVTTKQFYATVGKVMCTITSDNQKLKDGLLVPSNSKKHVDGSYLLEFNGASINVIQIDEMQKMPEILLEIEKNSMKIHFFEEDKDVVFGLLSPIAQTFDVTIDIVTIIDGWLIIDVKSRKYGNISKFITTIMQLFPKKIVPIDSIFEHIMERLHFANKKITFAESCTGGLLSYYFTQNSGASDIFNGSLITYSNDLKENWLGVDSNIILSYGAVSSEVVFEMGEGALNVSSADFAISISGIAGEGGGTEQKPVGTVYVGVKSRSKHLESRLNLQGDRNYIQHQSVFFAIKMLILMEKDLFLSSVT